jgi:hypothetical protein
MLFRAQSAIVLLCRPLFDDFEPRSIPHDDLNSFSRRANFYWEKFAMDECLPAHEKPRSTDQDLELWWVERDASDGRIWVGWVPGSGSMMRSPGGSWARWIPVEGELESCFASMGDSDNPNPEALRLLHAAMAADTERVRREIEAEDKELFGEDASPEGPPPEGPPSVMPSISAEEAAEPGTGWNVIEKSAASALMRKLVEYKKHLPRPDMESPRARSFIPSLDSDFDVNLSLGVFDLVRMEPGYVLDYIYAAGGVGGQPFLYARPTGGARVSSIQEYFERFQLEIPRSLLGREPTDEDSRPYLDHMSFEKTELGFLQFALFCMEARRFKLYDHSNNNRRIFILDDEERPEWIRARRHEFRAPTSEELGIFSLLDIRPKVQIHGDNGWVRVCNYELSRGLGFCIIELEWPNRLCGIADDIVVEGHGPLL